MRQLYITRQEVEFFLGRGNFVVSGKYNDTREPIELWLVTDEDKKEVSK